VEVLDTYDFARRYDWQTLLDGKVRRLRQGEDFTCPTSIFRAQANRAARRAGLSIRTRNEGDAIVIQAVRS
jgi:hypothetical protein